MQEGMCVYMHLTCMQITGSRDPGSAEWRPWQTHWLPWTQNSNLDEWDSSGEKTAVDPCVQWLLHFFTTPQCRGAVSTFYPSAYRLISSNFTIRSSPASYLVSLNRLISCLPSTRRRCLKKGVDYSGRHSGALSHDVHAHLQRAALLSKSPHTFVQEVGRGGQGVCYN